MFYFSRFKGIGQVGESRERLFDAMGPAGKCVRPALSKDPEPTLSAFSKGLTVYPSCSPLPIFR